MAMAGAQSWQDGIAARLINASRGLRARSDGLVTRARAMIFAVVARFMYQTPVSREHS